MPSRIVTEKSDYNATGLHFLQRWEWGVLKQPRWIPVRCNIDDQYIQVLLRKIPLTDSYLGYLPKPSRSLTAEHLRALISLLTSKYKISHLDVDLDLVGDEGLGGYIQAGFQVHGHPIQPTDSAIIKVDMDLDEYITSLDKKVRNDLKKSKEFDLEFSSFTGGEVQALDAFWEVLEDITENTGFITHPKSYFEKMWKLFTTENFALITQLRNDKGEVIASYLGLLDDQTFYEIYGGLKSDARKYRGASILMKIKTYEMLQDRGIKNYDLWGTAPVDPKTGDFIKSHEMYGISRFKNSFNPELQSYPPQYRLVINRRYYIVASLGLKLQKVYIKLLKSLRKS